MDRYVARVICAGIEKATRHAASVADLAIDKSGTEDLGLIQIDLVDVKAECAKAIALCDLMFTAREMVGE